MRSSAQFNERVQLQISERIVFVADIGDWLP
jgi:hypothetical protein